MVKLKLNMLSIFSILLIVAAAVFYLVWGIYYEGWNMLSKEYMGVYAITMVLLLFGILGFFLVRKKSEQVPGKK